MMTNITEEDTYRLALEIVEMAEKSPLVRFACQLPLADMKRWVAAYARLDPEEQAIERVLISLCYEGHPKMRFVELEPDGTPVFQRVAADLGEWLAFRGQAGEA
jgi:hypothetical protein